MTGIINCNPVPTIKSYFKKACTVHVAPICLLSDIYLDQALNELVQETVTN